LVVFGLVRPGFLAAYSRSVLAAENLVLRKQLALLQKRKVEPRRADDSTPWMTVTLRRMFQWRDGLVNVKPDTLMRCHRKGFRLFWRLKSKPTGRLQLPKNLRPLIRKMAAQNPTWGEERITNELKLKLGIRVSPRTVDKYLRSGGPVRAPDLKQRRPTFVHNHAKVIVACDFFVVVTTSFRILYVFVILEFGHPANCASQRNRAPNCGLDPTAIPGDTSGRPSVSIRDPRPG
jgi:hypothetical protein